jgi:hypothetical protein
LDRISDYESEHLGSSPNGGTMNLRNYIPKESLRRGDKVTYISFDKKEHGIIKNMSDEHHVFVVYNCAGNWNKYEDYTAARTELSDLVPGWR